jgi:asparagine synthase (glutamine-hydrolysing)
LYYAELKDKVAFASEIKALLPLLPESPEVNPVGLAQFLQNQFNSGEECIVKGIKRLPPGKAVAIDKELRLTPWRYWSALDVEPRRCTFEEAREEFDGLMDLVLREHMRSDVPYGLFLSGGVDSGLLLARLSRLHERPLRTFSVGYVNTRMKNELEDAERVMKRFPVQHTPVLLDERQILHRLPHTIWATDDLMRDYACLPTSFLGERTSKELKVVFTGEGGDEVFAGYGRYRKSGLQRFMKNLIAPGSGGFQTRGQLNLRWAKELLGPDLAEAARSVRAPFIAAWQETPKSWSYVQRSQYTDMATALPDNLLVKVDRILMAWGVEGRVPYLDHRIVEFGLSLPDDLKVRCHQGKLFLRKWGERFLPKEHLHLKKRGFHVPVGDCLKGSFLKALSQKVQNNAAVRTWFKPEGVKKAFRSQEDGHNASREIWSLMQFAIWHRLFIENGGSRPAPDENPLDWIS